MRMRFKEYIADLLVQEFKRTSLNQVGGVVLKKPLQIERQTRRQSRVRSRVSDAHNRDEFRCESRIAFTCGRKSDGLVIVFIQSACDKSRGLPEGENVGLREW